MGGQWFRSEWFSRFFCYVGLYYFRKGKAKKKNLWEIEAEGKCLDLLLEVEIAEA